MREKLLKSLKPECSSPPPTTELDALHTSIATSRQNSSLSSFLSLLSRYRTSTKQRHQTLFLALVLLMFFSFFLSLLNAPSSWYPRSQAEFPVSKYHLVVPFEAHRFLAISTTFSMASRMDLSGLKLFFS